MAVILIWQCSLTRKMGSGGMSEMNSWLELLKEWATDTTDNVEVHAWLQEAIAQRNRLLAGLNSLSAQLEANRDANTLLMERFAALCETNAQLRQELDALGEK
jgi:ABC-type transporter Mla subunit MlaD